MDGIIEKFNIFDLFTMLIPGVIISILFGISLSYECFLLGIHTVRKVCGGYQPATAGF